MNRIANIIVRYPKSIILCCSLVTLVMAFGMTRLETRNNYKGNLPANDPIIRTNARFEEVFGNEQIMMVAVESEALFSPASLKKIKRISDALATVEGVPQDGVTSLATLPASQLGGSPPGASSLLTALLEHPDASDTYLEQLLTRGVPTGRLVSKDGSTALILVRIARTADQTTVARQIRDIVKTFEGPERMYTIGDFIVAQEIDDGIEGDLHTLLPLALILVGFFASFRNLQGMALPLLVILGSIVWTLGLMGYLGFHLNVVTSTIPILLVATASSYGIHVIHRYNGEPHHRETATRRMLQRIGPPVLLTGITSAIGTLTLLLFQVTSIREFGIFAAAGIFFAMVLAIVLVPAILTLLKQPQRQRNPDQQRRFSGRGALLHLGTFSLKHRRFVLVMTLLLIAGSGVGVMRIRLGIDPVKLFPKRHPFQEAAQVFNNRFSGWRYFNIMVERSEANSVKTPAFLKSILNFQYAAGRLQKVGDTRSIIDAFQHIHSIVHPEKPLPFSIPDSRQDIENSFRLYAEANSGRGGTPWIDKDFRRARITVMITTSDHEEQLDLYQRLQNLARTHFSGDYRVAFGGSVLLWIAGNHYVAIGKIYNIAAAILFVFVFCALAFRSASNGLLSVIPLAIATLCTFGVMGFCDIRLNMATAIITSIGVGVGVDFAIHFLSRLQEERARGHTLDEATRRTLLTAGKAICFDVASNMLGFIVFAFSGFTPIQNLGWLVSLTMGTSALGTLVLLPPLVAIFGEKRDRLSDRPMGHLEPEEHLHAAT